MPRIQSPRQCPNTGDTPTVQPGKQIVGQTNLQLVLDKVLNPKSHSHVPPSPPEGLHRDPPPRWAAQLIPLPKTPRIEDANRRLNLVGVPRQLSGLFSSWKDLQKPGSSCSLARTAGGQSTGTGDDRRMRKYTGRDDARALHDPRSSRDGGTTIPRMLRAAGRLKLTARLHLELQAAELSPLLQDSRVGAWRN